MPVLLAALAASVVALATPREATPSLQITRPVIEERDRDQPEWAISVAPFPLIYMGTTVELQHTPGAMDQYGILTTGLSWYGKDVYDPRTTTPKPLASYTTANGGLSPYLDARAGYGLNVFRSEDPAHPANVRVYLAGHYVGTNIEASSATWLAKEQVPPGGFENHYDPDALVAHRPIITVGPHFDADFTDDAAFPTRGFQFKGALDYGPSWLGNQTKSGKPNDFGVLRARASQFLPLAEDIALVLSGVGGYGLGKLPVYSRFSAGGTDFLRGYLPDRFAGDRMLVGSAEFRHLILPGILDLGDLGFSYHLFMDAGRVWETSCDTCAGGTPPVAFPNDLRLGVGAGIGLMAGRSTLLQFDVGFGSEGLVIFPLGNGALKSPIAPVFGLSLSETW